MLRAGRFDCLGFLRWSMGVLGNASCLHGDIDAFLFLSSREKILKKTKKCIGYEKQKSPQNTIFNHGGCPGTSVRKLLVAH